MLTKNNILFTLKKIKPQYESEGVSLLGLFGSYATNKQTDFSDIDILYHLDYYDKFSKKYSDGFSKLIRLNEIKKDLESEFKTKVDFVSDNNKNLLKEAIYI